MNKENINKTLNKAIEKLNEYKGNNPYWRGQVSSSAFPTTAAISALCLTDYSKYKNEIEKAVKWLYKTQNSDGGWGFSPKNKSDIIVTSLGTAALKLAKKENEAPYLEAMDWVNKNGGYDSIKDIFDGDLTIPAPIYGNLVLANLISWDYIPSLPFWVSIFPREIYGALGLSLVTYGLPQLISVGLLHFKRKEKQTGLKAWIKKKFIKTSIKLLEEILPSSGCYTDAAPSICFVIQELVGAGLKDNNVVKRGIDFLLREQKDDGSWQIVTSLAVWNTSLSSVSLGKCDEEVKDWLLEQQTKEIHPFLKSAPGGWGWVDSDGSIPDADDTSGALIALSNYENKDTLLNEVKKGIIWLLNLQNNDGGWPTFCKGWVKLPFDGSCPYISAYVMRSFLKWKSYLNKNLQKRITKSMKKGNAYLLKQQNINGFWLPLWFGNEDIEGLQNKVFGTAKVLMYWAQTKSKESSFVKKGIDYILNSQNEDGSWGGDKGIKGSIEETSVACDSLLYFYNINGDIDNSIKKGIEWLENEIITKGLDNPTPIGLYFAMSWYYEELYPMIFSISALKHALDKIKNYETNKNGEIDQRELVLNNTK